MRLGGIMGNILEKKFAKFVKDLIHISCLKTKLKKRSDIGRHSKY